MARIRKRTVTGSVLVLVSLAGYLLFKYMGRELSETTIVLNILGIINVVLIVILLFMILRGVVKPFLEGRRFPKLNLSLRAKMTTLALLLVIVPAGVVMGMGTVIIYNILDNWHNPDLSATLESARALVSDYETAVARETAHYASVLGEELTEDLLRDRERLPTFLKSRLARYRLSSIELYHNGKLIAMIWNESQPLHDLKPVVADRRGELERGESFNEVKSFNVGTYVRFGTLLPAGRQVEDRYMVVTGRLIIRNLARHLNELSLAYGRYSRTEQNIRSLKIFNISSLLLIAILAIFSGTWAGLKFTDHFLKAFQLLLLGTERVAAGELEFGIEVQSQDEMGRLIQSFNRMIDRLRTHEQELRLRAIELESVNRFLQDRRHYFEAVLDTLPVGVISISNFGNVMSINRFARDMLRIRGRVEEGTRLSVLLGEEGGAGELNRLVRHITQEPQPNVRQPISFSLPDGVRSTDVSVTGLMDRNENEIGYLIIIEDITKLEQAQKTLAWKEAVRRIVHELKNPLTPIKLAAERIRFQAERDSGDLRTVVLDSVKPMIEEIITMQRLIENFSRYAKMPPPKLEECDVHVLLDEVIQLLEPEAKQVTFRRVYAEAIPMLRLDRALMKSAFLNIMRNALAAMQQESDRVLTVKTIFFAAGGRTKVEISDTGKGIPADLKEKVFIPYFSTKAKGDGLGLAIVHNIVTAHGGHILVKDNYPRGSTFVIDLPVGMPVTMDHGGQE